MQRKSFSQYLAEFWVETPMAVSVVRASECVALERVFARMPGETLPRPLLDLGCGDGLFGQVLLHQGVNVGLDLSARVLRHAAHRGTYLALTQADACNLPFAEGALATICSNCVLEHIPDLPAALAEIRRVLRPGGRLLLTVPTDTTADLLQGARLLHKLGRDDAAERYKARYNRLVRHHNLHGVDTWRGLLSDAGLRLEQHLRYGEPSIVAWHDLLTPVSLPHVALQRLTGRFVLWPGGRRRLAPLAARLMLRLAPEMARAEQDDTVGHALLLVAVRDDDPSSAPAPTPA